MAFRRRWGYSWIGYTQYGTFRAWDSEEKDTGLWYIVATIETKNNPRYPNCTYQNGYIKIKVRNFKDVELHEVELETNLVLSQVDVTFFKIYLLRMLNYTS